MVGVLTIVGQEIKFPWLVGGLMRDWIGVIQNKAHLSPGRVGVGAWTDLGNILGLHTSMPGSLSFGKIFLIQNGHMKNME